MISRACEDILGNFFSKGEISFTSGSLIPTNSGFLRNTSLWRGVKLPEIYHMYVIYSGALTSKILIDDSNHTRLAYIHAVCFLFSKDMASKNKKNDNINEVLMHLVITVVCIPQHFDVNIVKAKGNKLDVQTSERYIGY